jgi:hypothetical protein
VRSVLFDAEPVPCQGGRINYTVWFLGTGDCGNPYRPDGLFSITLNRPYADDGTARKAVIAPMLDLYAKYRNEAQVHASEAFLSRC